MEHILIKILSREFIEFIGSNGKLYLCNDSRELYFYKLVSHKGLSNYELNNFNPIRIEFDHDLALLNLYESLIVL